MHSGTVICKRGIVIYKTGIDMLKRGIVISYHISYIFLPYIHTGLHNPYGYGNPSYLLGLRGEINTSVYNSHMVI